MTIVSHDGREYPDPEPGDAVRSSRGYITHSFARMREERERPRGGWFAWGVAECGTVIDATLRNEETGSPRRFVSVRVDRCARCDRALNRKALEAVIVR